MIIINNIAGQWTAIPLALINDSSLSYAAKGVYMRIAALPEKTEVTAKLLQGELNKRTIATLMLELLKAGWLRIIDKKYNGQKVYQLLATRVENLDNVMGNQGAKSALVGCKKCTQQGAENAPYNKNNIYNNILDNIREDTLPDFYHFPFDKRLTIEQKRNLVIKEVDKYVKSGAIEPDEARMFVLYWTEPMMFLPNSMRMEDPELKCFNLETRLRIWNERKNNSAR